MLHLRSSGLFILNRSPRQGEIILRFGSLGRGGHRPKVSLSLIERLGRHNTLLIEILHTLKALFCQDLTGQRFLPDTACRINLLNSSATQRLTIKCLCSTAQSLGLQEFCREFGGCERIEHLPLMHTLSLGHKHRVYTSRNLRRSAIGATLNRALHQQRFTPDQPPPQSHNHRHGNYNRRHNGCNIHSFHTCQNVIVRASARFM